MRTARSDGLVARRHASGSARAWAAAAAAATGLVVAVLSTSYPGGGRSQALVAVVAVGLAAATAASRSVAAWALTLVLAVGGVVLSVLAALEGTVDGARLAGYGVATVALLSPPLWRHLGATPPRT